MLCLLRHRRNGWHQTKELHGYAAISLNIVASNSNNANTRTRESIDHRSQHEEACKKRAAEWQGYPIYSMVTQDAASYSQSGLFEIAPAKKDRSNVRSTSTSYSLGSTCNCLSGERIVGKYFHIYPPDPCDPYYLRPQAQGYTLTLTLLRKMIWFNW